MRCWPRTWGVRMTLRGRVAAIWLAMLMALSVGTGSPAAAQDTPGEYRTSIDNMYLEMRALWGELERFKVANPYCNPSPPPPSKAQAQAELAALEQRANDLNRRYNALKQSLLNFLDHNHRLYAEMMVNGRDPRDRQWWSREDNNRQRMLDELARKKAALAAAREVDCRPKPKPQKPAATIGGFQAPALPVIWSPTPATWPALPKHFCSYDEKIEFLKKVGALLDQAGADAERAARSRTEVEQAVNSYVQNDRPIPPELIARRRQAIADVEAANRRVREANDNYNRANAIPVIDCRTPQQEHPSDRRMRIIFDEHNKERDRVGVPRLQWDAELAAGAQSYAAELARTGRRVHAPREGRGIVRENLNQGMLGWSAGQMVQNWLKEKQNFHPGTYPDVTRTERWQDVSHYTQMIWPATTHVGCGLAAGSGYQWLVCRYSPGGNKDGQLVGLPSNQPVIARPDLPRGLIRGQPDLAEIEDSVRDLEREWLDREFRDELARRFRDELLNDNRLPVDKALDWIKRLDKLVGDRREKEAPLPPTDTRRVHDTPMPQPYDLPKLQSPPTAADPAPAGYEWAHPLYFHFEEALELYKGNPIIDMSASMAARELALRKMRYAYQEMLKRYKAAKAAKGARRVGLSTVQPEDVKKVLDYMEKELRKDPTAAARHAALILK